MHLGQGNKRNKKRLNDNLGYLYGARLLGPLALGEGMFGIRGNHMF
jgi:hypothetical protein